MPKKDADPFSCFQLPDGRWRAVAQTKDAAGKSRPKGIERKSEADCRKAMRDWLRAHGRLNPAPGMSVDAMLEAFIQRCVDKGRAEATLRKYRRYRKAFQDSIGHVPVDRLMPSQVEAALDMIEGGANAVAGRAFLRAAINKIARKAAPNLPNVAALADAPEYRPGEQERLTEQTLELVLAKEESADLRALWVLLAGTGMRPAEARTLVWPEVEEREDGMWVRKAASKTKEGKRPIPVPQAVADTIRALPKRGIFVFPSVRTGKAYDEATIRAYWRAAAERAGLPEGINLYQLRHLFGTVQARKQKDHVLKRLMRHTDVRTTKMYYVDENDAELRRAVDG